MRPSPAFPFLALSLVGVSAHVALGATVVDVPCANEIVVEAQGAGPNGVAFNYDQPVGVVVHTAMRMRERPGEPLKHTPAAHQRYTHKDLAFEGLKGVVRHEYFTDGETVTESYTQTTGKTVAVWQPLLRVWRRCPIAPFPVAADGRTFRVSTRNDETGVLESVLHYRYVYVPELRCPWNGKVFKDLYALVLERADAFDERGQPKGDSGARSVAYLSRGYGPLWGYQSTNRIGDLSAPDATLIDSDWFRVFDTNWPAR